MKFGGNFSIPRLTRSFRSFGRAIYLETPLLRCAITDGLDAIRARNLGGVGELALAQAKADAEGPMYSDAVTLPLRAGSCPPGPLLERSGRIGVPEPTK